MGGRGRARQGGGERQKMGELFPNSSRERKREGKGEELREGLCIVSSSECSKWWQFFFSFLLLLHCFVPHWEQQNKRKSQREEHGLEKLELL